MVERAAFRLAARLVLTLAGIEQAMTGKACRDLLHIVLDLIAHQAHTQHVSLHALRKQLGSN